VSKSTISSTIDVTILHGTMGKTTCSHKKETKKWFIVAYPTSLVTNVSLYESDDEKWMYMSSIFHGISK